MNMIYKQMYALVIFAMVATTVPMCGMENETAAVEQDVTIESSVTSCKKRSMYIAAVAMTTAVALYAVAVKMDKVSSPVVLAGMLFAKLAYDTTVTPKHSNDVDHNMIIDQDVVESMVKDSVEKLVIDVVDAEKEIIVDAVVQSAKDKAAAFWSEFVDFSKESKNAAMNITDKDLKKMHEVSNS